MPRLLPSGPTQDLSFGTGVMRKGQVVLWKPYPALSLSFQFGTINLGKQHPLRESVMLPPTFARTDSLEQAGHPSERRDNQRSTSAIRIEILQQDTKVALTGRVSNLSVGGCDADAPNTLVQRACEDAPWNQASCRRILFPRSLESWRARRPKRRGKTSRVREF